MRSIDPKETPVRDIFRYLLGGVVPRPIALVSTISSDGVVNLAPFSFFGAFGANPPTVAFSPSRRLRDNTVKDTYNNIVATRECVIQAVTHSILHQVNLTSADFHSEVDEFVKAGLTPVPSEIVKPPRVEESPFQLECKLQELIELGGGGASGNLALCEVVRLHIAEDVLVGDAIDPERLDLVARLGGDWYCRASGAALFELPKPSAGEKIGFDRLPQCVRESDVFTGSNLAQLAAFDRVPTVAQAREFMDQFVSLHKETEKEFYRRLRLGEYRGMLEAALALEQRGHRHCVRLFEQTAKCALDCAADVTFAWHVTIYAHRDHA